MDSGPRCVGLLVASFQQTGDRARSQDRREIDQFSERQLWFDAGPAPRRRAGGRSVPVRGRGAGGCAGGRRILTRLPPALGFHPSQALPSPSRLSSAPDPSLLLPEEVTDGPVIWFHSLDWSNTCPPPLGREGLIPNRTRSQRQIRAHMQPGPGGEEQPAATDS